MGVRLSMTGQKGLVKPTWTVCAVNFRRNYDGSQVVLFGQKDFIGGKIRPTSRI